MASPALQTLAEKYLLPINVYVEMEGYRRSKLSLEGGGWSKALKKKRRPSVSVSNVESMKIICLECDVVRFTF